MKVSFSLPVLLVSRVNEVGKTEEKEKEATNFHFLLCCLFSAGDFLFLSRCMVPSQMFGFGTFLMHDSGKNDHLYCLFSSFVLLPLFDMRDSCLLTTSHQTF